MRLIGTLFTETSAKRIGAYLKQKGIENNCEPSLDAATGQISYQLWIIDEDRMREAAEDLERFQKEPTHAEFDAPVALRIDEEERPIEEGQEEESRSRSFSTRTAPLTLFLIFSCIVVFLLNAVQEFPMQKTEPSNIYLMTPIQEALLFDLPPAVQAFEEAIEKRAVLPDKNKKDSAPAIEAELRELAKVPYWRGLYDLVLLKAQGKDVSSLKGPLFSRIRQGEVWRLFSPCILHSDLLHILFNMIWLWVLGRPIEQRIGLSKTACLTLISGIGSNVIQYLMSGPFFIGYSGVIMALAGFIWMRERRAPWEGYPLNRTTILFLLLFIGAMFLLTFASFFFQLTTSVAFAPNIANTAHIAGAFIGIFLGKFSFFSQRTIK